MFFGPIGKTRWPHWPIRQKGGTLYSGARYVALWASCFSKLSASLMKNYFPKRTSGTSFHTLSKLYDVPVGFVSPLFWAVYCYICGRRRMAVARYRMICLVHANFRFSGPRMSKVVLLCLCDICSVSDLLNLYFTLKVKCCFCSVNCSSGETVMVTRVVGGIMIPTLFACWKINTSLFFQAFYCSYFFLLFLLFLFWSYFSYFFFKSSYYSYFFIKKVKKKVYVS